MSDEESENPTERINQLRIDFEEAIASRRANGETLNVLRSGETRDSIEMYLKQSAEVLAACEERRPALIEMVIGTTAGAVPGIRRGLIRDTFMAYCSEKERERELNEVRREYERHGD